ncbi:hypothetical protein DRO29_04950 [Candidatus Bathyarchaeota archaeon]|nr:MAG: hypothetical protein DRO29_04950 [Candidatus Bathyarchaeota archaeon]
MSEEEECPACSLIDCFYKELNLSPEERKAVEKLHDDPQKAIAFLRKIRTEDELRRAFMKCEERNKNLYERS